MSSGKDTTNLEPPSKRDMSKMYTDLRSDTSGMFNETTQVMGGMGEGNLSPDEMMRQAGKRKPQQDNVELGLQDEDIALHEDLPENFPQPQ